MVCVCVCVCVLKYMKGLCEAGENHVLRSIIICFSLEKLLG